MFSQSAASCRGTCGTPHRRESGRSLFHSKKFEGFVAEFRQFEYRRRRKLLELFVGVCRDLEKVHEIAETVARVDVGRFGFAGFLEAVAEHAQGRLDLALFSL